MIILRNKLDFFLIVDDAFFINWLVINFSGWSLIFFSDKFFSILGRSNNLWVVDNFPFLLLNIQYLFNNFFSRLDVFFSNSSSSGDSDGNWSSDSLSINNGSILNLFSVDRSIDFLSSNNRSLNDSLSDDGLWNNFPGNDGLRNNSSFHKRLRNDFLSLNYLWFWIKNLLIEFSLSCHWTCGLIGARTSLSSSRCLSSTQLWSVLLVTSSSLLIDLNFLQLTWFNKFLKLFIRNRLIVLLLITTIWISLIVIYGVSIETPEDQYYSNKLNFHLLLN